MVGVHTVVDGKMDATGDEIECVACLWMAAMPGSRHGVRWLCVRTHTHPVSAMAFLGSIEFH